MGQTDDLDPRDTIRWMTNGTRQKLWYRCPDCLNLMGTVFRIDSETEPWDLVCCGECFHVNYRKDLSETWETDEIL